MFAYFFDIDDTLANSARDFDPILEKFNFKELSFEEQLEILHTKVKPEEYTNIALLDNSATNILKRLLNENNPDVYYLTARRSEVRSQTKDWLVKNNLWLTEERLIMDGLKKGDIIADILKTKYSNSKIAIFFDDMMHNHENAKVYSNIISCLP